VHEPIRLSDHLGENIESRPLREFVNGYIYNCFQAYVHEAVRLGDRASGGTNGLRVST
jgi:hypothetical protein